MRAGWNEASRIGLKIKKSLQRRENSSGRDIESIETGSRLTMRAWPVARSIFDAPLGSLM